MIIEDILPFDKSKSPQITVACAMPKNTRMEDIIDKLTQLGVERIIPLKTERVIVKLSKEKETSRISRWKKIAQSASEQSQRGKVAAIENVKSIEEVLSSANEFDLKLIPTLAGDRKSINSILSEPRPQPKPFRILILIGPEGDFTDDEVSFAVAGCMPVSLGDLVLRVDTAAIAVVAYFRLVYL